GRGQGGRRAAGRDRRSEGQARRSARPGREAPIHAVFPRLTGVRSLLSCLGCPIGRCRTVPVPRHWSALRTQRIRRKSPSFPGPLARVGGFFTPLAATVFENSAACVYVETSPALGSGRKRMNLSHPFGDGL